MWTLCVAHMTVGAKKGQFSHVESMSQMIREARVGKGKQIVWMEGDTDKPA